MTLRTADNERIILMWLKPLRFLVWFLFGFLFVVFILCVISIFSAELAAIANSTSEDSKIIALCFIPFLLLILFFQFCFYRRKIIADNSDVMFKYVFKKALKVSYREITKIVLMDRAYHWEVLIYGESGKIGGIPCAPNEAGDFSHFVKMRKVRVETIGDELSL